MRISTITGHLTQTNKKHIKIMIKKGLDCAKINGINYLIQFRDGIYSVTTIQVDNSVIIGEKTQKSTFNLI